MTPCPQCGGVLELVRDGMVGVLMAPATYVRGRVELRTDLQLRSFLACTECEYCADPPKTPRPPR